MRYSMLVYIMNMSRTLLEAAQYLRTAESEPMQEELLSNGRQMLGQIKSVLNRFKKDLRSSWPVERLAAIETLWKKQDPELEPLLTEFVKRLPQEVHYRVRAVFFAELGQKWDSMESVYEAMRDDPRFSTVVVLTPVFRVVNRNGKQEQEVLYKDYLTERGVPFLRYDRYSLEKDCPDLAFISQPYESCTLQEFWPETIAKYTRLVYLNYGILGAVYEDTIESFCRLPVFRYAWKIPGACERHYQYYSKYAVNGGGNMIVTGLPKFDPVVRIKSKKVSIPAAWESIIENRTVILWNTWYDPSRSSVAYFEAVTNWFMKHDDCALIWRMHPMTDTVVKLYYPASFYEQLRNCIAHLKAAPNMLVDENESYLPAFSCSDGMISDYSSMMFQYLVLDKPTLWIKQRGKTGPFEGAMVTDEFLIDCCWMEEAYEPNKIFSFMERVRAGEDRNAELRKTILNRDLPLADGRCGERVRDAAWEAMHKEDFHT